MKAMPTLDIWTSVVSVSDQHPNFRKLAEDPNCGPERAVLTTWTEGFRDRDGKIVVEFQRAFNSAFWEFYLNAVLRDLSFALDFTYTAPDFHLSKRKSVIIAEAAIASNAEGFRPEWDRDVLQDLPQLDQYAIVRTASLRLSNAIAGKARKYEESYAHMKHVQGLPFLLCLAPFDQPYFFFQRDHAIRRVLYGVDQPLWIAGRTPGERLVLGQSRTPHETKATGNEVPFGIFLDPAYADISAVLFSTTATMCKLRAMASGQHPVVFSASRYNALGTEPLLIAQSSPDYVDPLAHGLHNFFNTPS